MNSLPAATYDGDNTIMSLQFIKYLTSLSKNIPDHFRFLFDPVPDGTICPACPNFHSRCFQKISQLSMNNLLRRAQEFKNKGCSKEKI